MGVGAGAAAAIGAGISGAASLGSSLIQSGNVGRAAGQSQRNLELMLPQMQQNYNTQVGQYKQAYDTAVNQLSPYASAGTLSVQDQQDLLGLNGQAAADAARAKFQTSPGYQWTVDQAMRATNASAAQGEMLHSGATLKALEDRASQLANQEFGNYYNRLAGLSSLGENAATGISNAAFQQAGGVANAGANLISGESGNAQQQNAINIGAANAQNSILGNSASTFGNTINSLFSNKDFQNWLSGNNSSPPATTVSNWASGTLNNPAYAGVTYAYGPPTATQGY